MQIEKKWLLIFIVLITLNICISCIGGANTNHQPEFYTDPSQIINIRVNEEFKIILYYKEEGTGALWQAKYEAGMLSLIESRYAKHDEIPTAGGYKWYKFETINVGITDIHMRLVKEGLEYEKEVLDRKVFTVQIQ